MTDYYITGYNGYRLSDYGAVTPGVSGVHDLPGRQVNELWLPGNLNPHVTTVRRTRKPVIFRVVIAGDSHEELILNLDAIKGILDPGDDAFHPLRVIDRPGLEIMALHVGGFEVNFTELPGLHRVAELQAEFKTFLYWQDALTTTVHVDSSPQVITNLGALVTYPTYTCTVSDAMAGGLWFEVGASRFTYEGALKAADVLVVEADPQLRDVTLNDTRDWANVDDSEGLVFPSLASGANTVTLSDAAKFHMDVAWKGRYW